MSLISFVFLCGVSLFLLGLWGIMIRRNLLGTLMFLELMLNGVNLSLISSSAIHGNLHGAIISFLIFLVAACEMAIAIPIILLLIKRKKTLNIEVFSDLKG